MLRRKSTLTIIAALMLFVTNSFAMAQSDGFTTFLKDDFDSYNQNLWIYYFHWNIPGTNEWYWVGPEGGSLTITDGVLNLRPFNYRGSSFLQTKEKVITSLPAKVKFRIRFKSNESAFRGALIELLSQSQWGILEGKYVRVSWYLGETVPWGATGHIDMWDSCGNYSSSNFGLYSIPCDTWIEGEMQLFNDHIEANFNNNNYIVYGNVKSLLETYGGLYLRVATCTDHSQHGFDLDWIEIRKKPTISELIELKHQLYELGSIDNYGIVKSLDAKLNAAKLALEHSENDTAKKILKAFINEVLAQSGKHINSEAASKLVTYGEAILTSL
ncbi:MAG: hypothetical protein QW051_04985 [Candidatus Aenigmatarchaeota archaeon]